MAALLSLMPNPPSSIRFAIMISAFKPRDTSLHCHFSDGTNLQDVPDQSHATIASLHIMGTADEMVPNDSSMEVSRSFVNSKVHVHPGGHFIPSGPETRGLLKEFILDHL